MKRLLLSAALGLMMSALASATTIVTFDDLPGDEVVPDGYGGINWGGVWNAYQELQPPYTAHSAPFRVYDFNAEGFFSFLTPQVFDGAWFAGVSSTSVSFNLYDSGGNLLATSATIFMSDVPAFLDSGYAGLVSKVGVVSNAPDFFVMDDITYAGTATVPEPGSLVMVGGALLAGLTAVRRLRKS